MRILKSLIFVSLFVPHMASAGFDLITNLSTYKSESDGSGPASVSQLELRGGYSFDMGLFLGAFYSLGSDKFIQHADQYYIGPMIGYKAPDCGFYTLLGYVFVSEQDLNSGGAKYSGASGYQVSMGYALPIAEDIFLSPEITYRTVKYDKQEVVGIESSTDRKDQTVNPGLTLWFKF